MKQKQLILFEDKTDHTHGGSKAKGRRKCLRPLSSKHPIHLVLKANDPFRLLRNTQTIEQSIRKYARLFGVTIYEFAVHADHIHLSFKVPRRELYKCWIRAITSVLALKIPKLKWSLPPYTRVATWGEGFKRLSKYIENNKTEGLFLFKAHEHVDQYLHEQLAALGLRIEI